MHSNRGFREGCLLEDHVDSLAGAAGVDPDDEALWSAGREALRRLVITHLVIPMATGGCTVSLVDASRNPAYARWVNGLASDGTSIPRRNVTVPGPAVGEALLAVLKGEDAPAEPRSLRVSALDTGLSGLIDRQVDVTTIVDTPSTDLLVGRLVAVADDYLVLARTPYDEPVITVVPMRAVIAVSTHQLTEREDDLFDRV